MIERIKTHIAARIRFLTFGVLVIAAGVSSPAQATSTQKEERDGSNARSLHETTRPNVILMMADDLGWGDPSFGSAARLQTPSLDQMATDGLRLNRFYAAAPVCSPTRASMLTGRHPYRMGVFSANVGYLPEGEDSVAEFFQQNGYRTGHFGKWHLGIFTTEERDSNRGGRADADHLSIPSMHGFDVHFATEAKVPTYDPLLIRVGETSGKWWEPIEDTDESQAYGTAYWQDGEKVERPLRGDDSEIIMDQVLQFISQAADSSDPFFVVIWFHSPHLPVVGDPEWLSHFSDVEDSYTRHYYATVAALDEQVGRLRDHLENESVNDNTLLFFCSDNGPEGNNSAPGRAGGLRGRKRSLYDGGIRVPGIVCWPGTIEAGRQSDAVLGTSDLLPTLIDCLGESVAEDTHAFDGESFASLFQSNSFERETPIYFESSNQLAAIDNRFKLYGKLENAQGNRQPNHRRATPEVDAFELYDMLADPSEQNDVSDMHPEIVIELRTQLEAWRNSCRESRQQHGLE